MACFPDGIMTVTWKQCLNDLMTSVCSPQEGLWQGGMWKCLDVP